MNLGGLSRPQSWEDPDVPELLTWLEDELRAHIAELSSFDVYKKEVLSGSLDWTPMHTSVRPRPSPAACLIALHAGSKRACS